METQDLLENSRKKLQRKHADLIVANSLKQEGAGFQSDTNVVTIITETEIKPLEQMSKDQVAKAVLDEILEKRKEKQES